MHFQVCPSRWWAAYVASSIVCLCRFSSGHQRDSENTIFCNRLNATLGVILFSTPPMIFILVVLFTYTSYVSWSCLLSVVLLSVSRGPVYFVRGPV